jgi:hypothetical protein
MLGEDVANELFVLPESVERGGVEQSHALLQGVQKKLFCPFGSGRGAIGMTQVHAPEADPGDVEWADLSRGHFHWSASGPPNLYISIQDL